MYINYLINLNPSGLALCIFFYGEEGFSYALLQRPIFSSTWRPGHVPTVPCGSGGCFFCHPVL